MFTVFNPHGKLNVRNASPDVLQAVFALDNDELNQLLDARTNSTSNTGTVSLLQSKLTDPQLADLLQDESPSVVGVQVQAKLPSSRVAAQMEAVVDVGESNEGVYVLRWIDSEPPEQVQ